MARYTLQVLISLDQVINSLFGGWAHETLSARAWRLRERYWFWSMARRVIDSMFYWTPDHCLNAYLFEQMRGQNPSELG